MRLNILIKYIELISKAKTKQKIKVMLIVKVNGNIEKALKALKNKVIKTQQVQELQRRTEFEKPSVKRRMEIKDATYRQKKRTEADREKY